MSEAITSTIIQFKVPLSDPKLIAGQDGGFGANHHLRQSLVFLNVATMQQPEAYIGGSEMLFDQDGNVIDDSTVRYLQHLWRSSQTG